MTSTELTARLITNIETSLELRSRIPFLDMLRELAEGGATLSSAILNTSSNFGSFDTYLKEILVLLNAEHHSIISHTDLPLPLSSILKNIKEYTDQIIIIFEKEISDPKAGNEFLYRLELVNAAAV